MNENKKSAKWYHQFMITALKKKVNDMNADCHPKRPSVPCSAVSV